METREMKEALAKLSMGYTPMTRAELSSVVAAEWERMGKIVSAVGLTID
jgi:tripartite-type tricarboxylate transporter receptor subunit TctC